MMKAVRFTPEQKANMKVKALGLLEAGQSQQKVAKALGTTVTTLRVLIKGENYRRQNNAAPRKSAKVAKKVTKVAAPKAVVVKSVAAKVVAETSFSGPVAQLAQKHARLEAITLQLVDLTKEQASLRKEMKTIYEAVGKLILK